MRPELHRTHLQQCSFWENRHRDHPRAAVGVATSSKPITAVVLSPGLAASRLPAQMLSRDGRTEVILEAYGFVARPARLAAKAESASDVLSRIDRSGETVSVIGIAPRTETGIRRAVSDQAPALCPNRSRQGAVPSSRRLSAWWKRLCYLAPLHHLRIPCRRPIACPVPPDPGAFPRPRLPAGLRESCSRCVWI